MSLHAVHKTGFLVLTTTVLIGLQFGLVVDQSILIKALAISVLVAGIPHGAIDPALAQRFGVWQTRKDLFIFSFVYLAIAAAMVFTWYLLPTLTLVVFLLLSVWHFSGDWSRTIDRSASLPISLSILTLPALFHTSEVELIFRSLIGESAAVLTSAMATIAPIATLLAVYSAVKASTSGIVNALEILLLLACATLMPPLWFFLVYFCFLHSPRHILHSLQDHGSDALLNTALTFTALTVVLAAIAIVVLPTPSIDERLIKVVFIGLFALTVPHMILNDFLNRGESYES